MNSGAARHCGETPAVLYSNRLKELHQAQATEQRQEKLLGYAKVGLGFLILVTAVIFIHHPIVLESLLVPVVLFATLAVAHENRLRSLRLRQRNIHFYERGLARLENRWAGTGETGERFLDSEHPYARDLDLFGEASLFELLCTTRTRAGEETLAAWLLAAAPLDELAARQEAIQDLKSRVAFRERLFSLGETVRLGVHPEALSNWGLRNPVFAAKTTRVVTTLLAGLWILGMVGISPLRVWC